MNTSLLSSIKITSIITSIALIAIMAGVTFSRNIVWRDEMSLWKNVIEKQYCKERGYYILGNEFKKIGLLEDAIQKYNLAITFGKSYGDLSESYNNLGRIYEQKGLLDLALIAYKNAVKFNPQNAIAFNNLGLAYLDQNLPDEAIRALRSSILNSPNYAKAHYNLGRALAAKGLDKESNKEIQKALNLGLSAN